MPLVSFVVPCYKHGHFLAECVESILAQTFQDFEILIMDDCSPDETPVVARSFTDSRVIHVRNERNLGHLANYNKGIGLARGKYVWLINVDDYLRRPYVLEKFVAVMERTPSAAFVFCPAVLVHGRSETLPHRVHGPADRVFSGTRFLQRLLIRNCVPTPAVMVRRTSYDRVGMFPPDLPHAGDWYQWCRHALGGDVAYVAEPMVCYRLHDLNMTKTFMARPHALIADEVAVRWRVKKLAAAAGLTAVVTSALDGIAADYGLRLYGRVRDDWKLPGLTFEEFETSLREHSEDPSEIAHITGAVLRSLADWYYKDGDIQLARQYYRRALRHTPRHLATWAKYGLLATGSVGRALRTTAARARIGTASAA